MLPRDHALAPLAVSAMNPPQLKVTNDPASDKQILKQRRRTLQTISELTPHQATTQGPTGSLSRVRNDASICSSAGNAGSRSSRNNRRRSLPTQGLTIQRGYTNIPSNSITPPVAPTLHRSATDPNYSKGNARYNPRRRSMPTSFETRGRSLSPVAEGELSRQPIPSDDAELPKAGRSRSQRKQYNNVSRGNEHQEGGWNARRDRELMKRERALLEANARRERERLGLAIGSSSALPSLTPLSPVKGDDLIARQSRYYSQLPSLGQPASTYTSHRSSHSNNGRQVAGNMVEGRFFQGIETRESNGIPVRHGLRRSLSATSDPRWSLSKELVNRTISPAIRSSSSSSFLSASFTDRQSTDPRSSSSLQTSSNSTRSSSIRSSVSGTSSATKPSQRSSLTHTRVAEHPLRQNPIPGKQELSPALTQANLETKTAPPPMSHAFLGPQLIAQTKYSHGRPSLQNPDVLRELERERSRSRSRSRSQSTTSVAYAQKVTQANEVIFRENPDKRNLVVTNNPNGVREISREAAEKWVAREKIRERVRRANELEEEKERELIAEEKERKEKKKKKKKKKRSKGFLCGLFGKA